MACIKPALLDWPYSLHCLFKSRSIFLLYGIFSVYLLPIALAAPANPTAPESLPPSLLDIEAPEWPSGLYNDDELEWSSSWYDGPPPSRSLDTTHEISNFSPPLKNVPRSGYVEKRGGETPEIPDNFKSGKPKSDGILIKESGPDGKDRIVTYSPDRKLGSGDDGTIFEGKVYLATKRVIFIGKKNSWKKEGTGDPAAVKEGNVASIANIPAIMEAAEVKSSFLLPLTTYFKYNGNPWFVYPLWEGKLWDIVVKHGTLKRDVFFFFLHLLKGAEALHDENLIHHDIHLGNILANTHTKAEEVGITGVVLSDFGRVKKTNPSNKPHSVWSECVNLAVALLILTSSDPADSKEGFRAEWNKAWVDTCTDDAKLQILETYFPRKDKQGQELRSESLQNVLINVLLYRTRDTKTFGQAYVSTPDYQNAQKTVCERNKKWGLPIIPDC